MKYRFYIIFSAVITAQFFLSPAQILNASEAAPPALLEALMCEEVVSNTPKNPTVIFSASKEKAVCFSVFDPVPQKTAIYHTWYHRDVPSARIQLILKPPRWSTQSSIQLRRTDIGPWRVEITDERGRVFDVLRFSVTE